MKLFTVFHEEWDAVARETLREQREFNAGRIAQDSLLSIQLQRIGHTLKYVRERSPFYGKRLADWPDARIDAMTHADVATVPLTTKDDLRASLFDVPARRVDEAWVFYETTGTTGVATPCPRDNLDSIVNNTTLTLAYEQIFRAHGERHVVAVMGPTELHSTGDTFGDVLRNLGHTVVKMWPPSPVVGFDRALQMLRELRVTALVCTPGMAIKLAKEARRRHLDPAADFHLRLVMSLGELATPGMLTNLGRVWNAVFYNCMYASQEASILAVCHVDGILRTAPLNNYYEVLDPLTNQPAPTVDGIQQGELVVTTLYQGAKPLVRYRTGDMVRLRPVDEGGRRTAIVQPIGRARDALLLGGRPISAFDLESAVLHDATGCLDYFLVVDRPTDEDRLIVNLEMVDASAQDQLDPVPVAERISEQIGIPCEVRFGEAGAITSTGAMVSWKAARIHDRRHTGAEPEREAALTIARGRE